MVAPGRQARDEPAVDGARCGIHRAVDVLDRPGQLRGCEVGIEQQAGDLAHSLLVAGLAELVAD